MLNECQKIWELFLRDESGATAIEYVVLIAILAVGLIVGINGIAVFITDMWGGVNSNVSAT